MQNARQKLETPKVYGSVIELRSLKMLNFLSTNNCFVSHCNVGFVIWYFLLKQFVTFVHNRNSCENLHRLMSDDLKGTRCNLQFLPAVLLTFNLWTTDVR